MTEDNNKLRSLFLAAIMVTSVFVGSIAITGTAAAAAANVGVDSAVEYNSGNVEIVLNTTNSVGSFGDMPDGSTNAVVIVDGNEQAQVDLDGSNLITGNSGADVIRFDTTAGDITPNRNLTIKVQVTNNGVDQNVTISSDDTILDSEDGSVTVTSQSIAEGDNQNELRNTYQGETLAFVEDTAGDSITVSGPNGLVLDDTLPANAIVRSYSTENLELGTTYNVSFESGGDDSMFRVNNLDLDATAAATEVTTNDPISVDVSAIRGGADATATLYNSDDEVQSTQVKTLRGGSDVTFTFAAQSEGSYYVEVVDNQTGVNATTDTITVSEAAASDASIESVETDQRGDVFNITLGLTNADYATVTLGSAGDGYNSSTTVFDDDGDGEVTVQWNSMLADSSEAGSGIGDAPSWSLPSDSNDAFLGVGTPYLVNTSQTNIGNGPDHIVAAGSYQLEVRADTSAPADVAEGTTGSADDLGSLSVEPRDASNVTLWTAPAAEAGNIGDVEEVQEAIDEGLLTTQSSQTANEDLLVAQVEAEGLEGGFDHLLNNGFSAQNDTVAWSVLANSDNDANDDGGPRAENYDDLFNMTLEEDIGSASNEAPVDIGLDYNATSDTNDSNLQVIAAENSDTYYVLFDTGEHDDVDTTDYTANFTTFAQSDNQANFGLVAPNADGDFENEVVENGFETVERTGTIDTAGSGVVEVRGQTNQTVSGTSSAAPGTELSLRLQSDRGASSSFVVGPTSVVVQDDGTWSTDVDMSDYNTGVDFTATLSDSSEGGAGQLAQEDGTIRGPPEVLSLEFNDQTGFGEVVRVSQVELNSGGFVAIHQGSPTGEVIGASDYIDENEVTQNLNIALNQPLNQSVDLYAMPHLDTNANEDYEFEFGGDVDTPYTENGTPVTSEARYTLEGAEADFVVSNLTPMDVTVTEGAQINVSATITNEGDASGTQTVEFRVGGSAVASQEVSLDAGASQTVEFTNVDTTGLSGELTHGVFTDDGEQTATLTVEPETTPTPDDGTATPTPDDGTAMPTDDTTDDDDGTTTGDSGPGFGAIVALVAILGAALIAARRNN